MEKITKKILSVFLVFALMASVFLPVMEVYAASAPYLYPRKGLTIDFYSQNYTNSGVINLGGAESKVKVRRLKSSNENVATVSFNREDKHFVVIAKKLGKTVISFKLKYGNKTKKYKYKVSVKKAPNPISSFMLGGKELSKKFKNKTLFNYPITKKMKTDINIVPKNRWEILSIIRHRGNKSKTIKNNSRIMLKKGDIIYVDYKNKRTGKILGYNVYMFSDGKVVW